MRMKNKLLGCVVLAASSATSHAQTSDDPLDALVAPTAPAAAEQVSVPSASSGGGVASPLLEGAYIAPMGSFVKSNKGETDSGYGGVLALGYRKQWYAIEVSAISSSLSGKQDDGEKTSHLGGGIYGLLFPFKSLPKLYGIIGAGAVEVDKYPGQTRKSNFSQTTASAGAGYLWGFSFGQYELALRTEAQYRYGRREQDVNPRRDTDAPNDFGDVLINVGLHLPLSMKQVEAPAPVETVKVVPVGPPSDSDGDGIADPTDQCPDTPAGVQVDAVGCPLAPPPPPCKTPGAGERVSLSGCGTGDVIVLRGVNFEYDQARLTANAKTILDNVGEELVAHPAIEVELSGHTDSRGSDAYNQRLSEQRAKSVLEYLESKGVEASRMGAIGVGEAKPVADNETEEGRELNRRVELRVTAGAAKVEPQLDAPAPASEPAKAAEAVPAAEPAPAAPAGPSPVPTPATATEPATDDLDFLN